MKLIIVGQAPGPRSGPDAFDGRSGDRLARYMGLSDREELRSRVECLNVFSRYPGPDGHKGDSFPRGTARNAARRLSGRLTGHRVLLAGKRVGEAFGIRTGYLKWTVHGAGFEAVVIPHPSGVNHWWNAPENRMIFMGFARTLLGGQRG